jgi:hypothetical protein
MVKHDLH